MRHRIDGFMSKCAELGVPGPVAERMCKAAYELGSVNGEDSVSDLMYYALEDPEAKRYFHVDPVSGKRIPVAPPSRAGVTTMPISAEEQLDRYLMLSHDNPDYNRRIPIVRNGVPASTRWSGPEDLANLQSDAIRRRRGVRQPPGRRPTWLQRRIMEYVGRDGGRPAVKSAQSFGDGTFVLSKGQTPSHAARAWNASHPGSAVTPEQILAANPGVPATGFVAGREYRMPSSGEAPKARPAAPERKPDGKKAPIGVQRNNPGNLRSDGVTRWLGANLPGKGEFLTFDTPHNGFRALARTLYNYGKRHGINTLYGVVRRYAPASENDVASYLSSLESSTGWDRKRNIDLTDESVLQTLVPLIARQEIGSSWLGNYDASSVSNAVTSAIPSAEPRRL